MVKGSRLSAQERRISILLAAIPLFAKNGFNGTTTKQIAAAARVSEALIYRHFPSKESIYMELKDFCCIKKDEVTSQIERLTPSTSTLVHAIYFLVSVIFIGEENENLSHKDMHRLMANSYLEDGGFARLFIEENVQIWVPILSKCFDAAKAAGDVIEPWIDSRCSWWFAHHLAVALGFLNLPREPVIQYGVTRESLLDQAVRFCLRGMGLTDAAIKTHYNPAALTLFGRGFGLEI